MSSQLQAEAKRSPAEPEKDLVDIKQLRQMRPIELPTSQGTFRSWKLGMLHGLVSFDSTGKLRDYIASAMDLRGEDQQRLKFAEHPLNQAMGILGSKLMH